MSNLPTRTQIISAADDLFYHQGFEHTSFAHIADVVKISRGNFYHHFKTKDDILKAVLTLRETRTQEMLACWDRENPAPQERIKSYIKILLTNWDKIKEYGCPVGTLSAELAKVNHLCQQDAHNIFTLFRVWLKTQFSKLGDKADADARALHVLAWSQGVAVMGNAFQDKNFVEQEVRRMCHWLDSITADKIQPRIEKE